MAITDILTYEGAEMENSFARGNIGTLVDVQSSTRNEFLLPALGVGQIFPSANYVDLGITYGPTGADYTGNLVQPVISNVLTGVQYGANGTEFTGTATGSGGEESYIIID